MYRIFISYRRSDSESFSGRLRDRLRQEFGTRSVFMDTTTIPGGAKFDEAIAQNVKSCKVFVAVIGKSWLDCKNDAGTRRLDDEGDWVRKEMAQALARDDVLVIPVIFGGARMPGSEALPPALQSLARRNAVAISDADFDSDVARLIAACEPHVPRPRRWPWVAGAAVALLAAVGGWFYSSIKQEFRGVYVVPGPGFSGSLPMQKNTTRVKKFYLSLSTGGKHFGIQDFTRTSVLVVSESGLDGPVDAQDIAALRAEIAQHFKSKGGNDADAVAATLSSQPVVVSQLKVRPGAKLIAEFGIAEPDAAGGIIRQPRARCEFIIPEAPEVPAPVLYIAKASSECKSPG